MSRLRSGEWLALLAALALFGVLFGRWFDVDLGTGPGAEGSYRMLVDDLHRSGWGALGWFLDLLLALVIAGGVLLAATTVLRLSPAVPVAVAVVTWSAGALTWFILLFVVLSQPDLGIGAGNRLVAIEPLAWIGLLLAALVPTGAFLAIRDERTDAPESVYEPPPAQPLPDA